MICLMRSPAVNNHLLLSHSICISYGMYHFLLFIVVIYILCPSSVLEFLWADSVLEVYVGHSVSVK